MRLSPPAVALLASFLFSFVACVQSIEVSIANPCDHSVGVETFSAPEPRDGFHDARVSIGPGDVERVPHAFIPIPDADVQEWSIRVDDDHVVAVDGDALLSREPRVL